MSFAKARIHRFNDDVSCAPPPGAYDPKYDDKSKSIPIILHPSERFPEKKMTAETRSLCSSVESLESNDSSNVLPFRTPQLPRRRKIALTPSLSSLKLDPLIHRPSKNCASSKCECKQKMENQQREIQHLERLINDMKEDLKRIGDELVLRQKEEQQLKEESLKTAKELSECRSKATSQLKEAEFLIKAKKAEMAELVSHSKHLESLIEQKQQTILSVQAALSNMSLEMSDIKKDHENEKARLASENIAEHTQLKNLIEELKDKMQIERSDYNNCIDDLKNQISELESKCVKGIDAREDLEAETIEREGFISDLQEQIASLQDELNDVQGIKEALEERIKVDTAAKEARIADLEGHIVCLERKVQEMKVEKEVLMAQNANSMLELSVKHEERLQTIIETFENRLQALNSSLTEDESNYRGLQAWIADRLDELQTTRTSDLQKIETDFEKKLEEIMKSYSVLETKVKSSKAVLHSRISKYTAESESKYNQIFDRLAGKKKRAESERDSLKITNQNYEVTIKELEDNLAQAQKDAKKFQLASENAQAAVEALSSHLSECGTQIESLQSVETDLTKEKEELLNLLKEKEIACEELQRSMNDMNLDIIMQVKLTHDSLQAKVDGFRLIYEEKLQDSLTEQLKLEDKVNEFKAVVERQIDEIQKLQTELEIESEKSAKSEENFKQLSSVVTSINSLFNSNNDVNSYVAICDCLNNFLEDAKEKLVLINQFEETLAEKEKNIQESEESRKELLERYENLENRMNDFLSRNEEQLAQLTLLQSASESSQNVINCLTAEQDSLNCRILGLQTEIESLNKLGLDKDKTIESLTNELILSKETIAILDKDIDQLNITVENYQAELKGAYQSLEDKQNEIVCLESSLETYYSKLKEREDFQDKVAENEKLLKALMKEKSQIMNDYTEKVHYLETLNAEYLDKLQIETQTMKEEESKCQVLKEENRQLREQIEKLQDENESLKVVVSRNSCNLKMMSDKLTDYNLLEKKIKDVESESKSKDGALEEVTKDLERIKKELEDVTKRKNEYKEHYIELEEKFSTLTEVKDKYKRYAAELEKKNATLTSYERMNEDLKKKCSELENLIGPFRGHLEDYERENQMLESRIEASEEEKITLLHKFGDLLGHQNPKQKIKQINKIIEEKNELTRENERLRKQIKKLKSAEKLNVENGLNSLKIEGNLSPCLPKSEKLKCGLTPLRERN